MHPHSLSLRPTSPAHNLRAAHIVASLLVLAICSAACSGSPSRQPAAHRTPTVSAASALALVGRAARDALDQGFVHVAVQHTGGGVDYTIEEDLTVDGGHRVLHLGAMRAVALRFANHAFLSGNDAAMVGFWGLVKAKRARWEGRWVRIGAPNPSFSAVRDGFSLGSIVRGVLPVAPFTAKSTSSAGLPAIAITGRLAPNQHAPRGARLTLYVSSGHRPLPLRASETGPGGIIATVSFSRWGEQLDLKPPAHAIPWSSLIR